MDPRGTIAKRRKYGRFLPHQVDDDTSKHHLSASNYGRENEWVLLDPLAAQSTVSRCVRSQFLRAPRRYGTVS